MAIAFVIRWIWSGIAVTLCSIIHSSDKRRAPCDYAEASIHSQVTNKKGAWILTQDTIIVCMFDCALAGITNFFLSVG